MAIAAAVRRCLLAALALAAAAAVPGRAATPGTYSGTTQQGRPFSVTVGAGGNITGWSLGYQCTYWTATVSVTSACAVNNDSFACGTAYCSYTSLRTRITGTFLGDDASGTITVNDWPYGMGSCCSLANMTWTATIVGPGGFSFSASAYAASEGVTVATITVRRTGGRDGAVSVNYSTSDGTAVGGQDYQPTSGTLTWADEDGADKTFEVTILGDGLDEDDETLGLTLGDPAGGATLKSPSTAVLTITDDDAPPSLSYGDASVAEGNAGSVGAEVSATLSAPSGKTVTADWATAEGLATDPEDFTAASGTVIFSPGETAKPVPVAVQGDTLDESDETFQVLFSNLANAVSSDGGGTVTILDDDAPPSLSIADAAAAEGSSGPAGVEAGVTLSAPSGKTVVVSWAASEGTATDPEDFQAASGSLTFQPGETSKPVSIEVQGDLLDEPDETFQVSLSSPVDATIGDATATVTLQDDDAPPALAAGDASATEGGGTLGLGVTLSAASGRTVTVGWATGDGSAAAPADYAAASGTLTFLPGETSKTVDVQVEDDALDEDDEGFSVSLADPVNASIADAQSAGLVLDDDPTPSLSVGDVTVTEGNPPGTTTAQFTVSLSAESGRTVTAAWTTADGTAAAPDDYAAGSSTLSLPPGQTSDTVVVAVQRDELDEDDETFTLELSGPGNATLADGSGLATILDDDGPGILSFSLPAYSVTEDGLAVTVTAQRSEGRIGEVSVAYTASGGTATSGKDYAPVSGTLTWPAGDGSPKSFDVTILNDPAVEGSETVDLVLADPTGGGVLGSPSAAVLTILDEDLPADFYTLTPCRVLDTRTAEQGPALTSGQTRIAQVAGQCGIPVTAVAVAFNVTVVGPTGQGHLTVFPGDGQVPSTSTVNFIAGVTRPNNAILALAANGDGTVAIRPAVAGAGTVHLILDATGYFE